MTKIKIKQLSHSLKQQLQLTAPNQIPNKIIGTNKNNNKKEIKP